MSSLRRLALAFAVSTLGLACGAGSVSSTEALDGQAGTTSPGGSTGDGTAGDDMGVGGDPAGDDTGVGGDPAGGGAAPQGTGGASAGSAGAASGNIGGVAGKGAGGTAGKGAGGTAGKGAGGTAGKGAGGVAGKGAGGVAGSTGGGAAGKELGGSDSSGTYSNGVSIIVEPSDGGNALRAAILAAKTSVHVTMYLLSSSEIIDALIAVHKSGVAVKVVLQKTFPTTDTSNQQVHDQLTSAGVSVAWASSTFTLTHEKCVIIDGASAWIMTMNLTYSAPKDNREYLALDTDPADVAEAESIFAADFAGTAATVSGKLLVAPVNARARLLALLKTATKSVDVEGEEFSDSMITEALDAAADKGVKVRLVLPATAGTTAQTKAVSTLKTHGVSVVGLASPYVHAKAIVVDGARAYVGSENFTTASLVSNRELGLVTQDAAAVSKVATTIATDFGAGSPM